MDDTDVFCPVLPEKLYFRIGEVSEISEIPTYVLRFWETEFSAISPKRTDSGQRLYRTTDVQNIFLIKHLLYKKKFTIQGAKRYLKTRKPATQQAFSRENDYTHIQNELKHIRHLLDELP